MIRWRLGSGMLRGWRGGGDRVPFFLFCFFNLASNKISLFFISFPPFCHCLVSIMFWYGGVDVKVLLSYSCVDDGWMDGWMDG